MSGFVRWIHNHDESWLFVGVYIGFAVVLSVMLSLFWLVAMVAIHFAFEVIRHSREYDRWPAVLSMASWEVRVDIALVLLAFAVSLYMDAIMGIVGLQSAGRAAMATQAASRVGTRAVAWQRAVRAVVLGFDDVANAIRAVFMRKKSGEAAAPTQIDPMGATDEGDLLAVAGAESPGSSRDSPPVETAPTGSAGPERTPPAPTSAPLLPGWGQKWSVWDHLTMALKAGCLAAMVAAPGFTGSTYAEAVDTLRDELRPFPAAEAEEPAGQAEVPAPQVEIPAAITVEEGET